MSSLLQMALKDFKRAFYFFEQRACCYLRIHPDCVRLHGAMVFVTNSKRALPQMATFDHLDPKANGGSDARNLLLSCSLCNNLKAEFEIATAADFVLAAALYAAWRFRHDETNAVLQGQAAKIAAPIAVDIASLQSAANAAERTRLMRAAGFALPGHDGPWIKGADGKKVDIGAAKKPVQPVRPMPAVELKPSRTVAEAVLTAKPSQLPPKPKQPVDEMWRRTGGAASTVAQPIASKQARAASLGVTDERFTPGAKTRNERNLESQLAAAKGTASRAKEIGDKVGAHNMTKKAEGILRRLAELGSTAVRGGR